MDEGAFSTPLLGDDLRWGSDHNGCRLGIGASQDVIVAGLHNGTSETRDITLGHDGSGGPVYNVRFTGTTPGRGDLPVFDVRALKDAVTGFRPAIKAVLKPGAETRMQFHLSELIAVENRRDVPLKNLLHRGYRLHAVFEAEQVRAESELRPNTGGE